MTQYYYINKKEDGYPLSQPAYYEMIKNQKEPDMIVKYKILESSKNNGNFDRGGPYPIRLFDPIDENLERLSKASVLKNPSELPFDKRTPGSFLLPNGDYVWSNTGPHSDVIIQFIQKLPIPPKKSLRPSGAEVCSSFYKELNVIKVTNDIKPCNKIDYMFTQPVTEAQLRTIYRTYKDIPDLRITYDIVDYDKLSESSGVCFETSGQGYRELLTDLRKMDYLLN